MITTRARRTILVRMAILPIRIVGDPVLHKATEPVTQSPAEIAELIADMYETMDAANGVGLAANQVGVPLRVFVYDCPGDDRSSERRRGVVVNPVLETSEIPQTMPDPDEDFEGCLSVPGEQFPTGRADWAKVTGTDATATRSRSRAPDSSHGCSSTRPGISTVSSTRTY